MLGYWKPHKAYQESVIANLTATAKILPESVREYEPAISKLYLLDLDCLLPIIKPLYSHTGRKSEYQPEIFRSLVLMTDQHICLDNWVGKLSCNPVLRTICGFNEVMPSTSSYYDFINRLYNLDDKPVVRTFKRKPTEKYTKGEKMPPKHSDIVSKLVKKIIEGRRFNSRPELTLQKIFARVAVDKSVEMGLVSKTPDVSGDGTCIGTAASPYGRKICKCKEYNCSCPRRFSDPNSTWGWDSYEARYFYGYTEYIISHHNKDAKLDLPLYLRFVGANRHDSISAVVALSEFRDLHPNLTINSFISDSASDNQPTYELLHHWNINAVIALNPRNTGNFTYTPPISVDSNGVPICQAGHNTCNWGFDHKRCRIKWRCPRVFGKAGYSDACASCSTSEYGRTFYTKPTWDLRLFTRITRGSEQWKLTFNKRTASERVNNRLLNHYNNRHVRGKKRISFFSTLAAINLHLDAWIQANTNEINSLFNLIFDMHNVA